MIMVRPTRYLRAVPAHGTESGAEITDISFCAWLAQAEAGDALIYHRGLLVVDKDHAISTLPAEQRLAVSLVADAAFRAAQEGLVHLVQKRLAMDRFLYIAIARPGPTRNASLVHLLEAA